MTHPDAKLELDALRSATLLAAVEEAAAGKLAGQIDQVRVPARHLLIEAGSPPDATFVVASGRLAVLDPAGHVISEARRGDALGELGVIAQQPRSADVRAVRDSVVWRVPAEAFWQLLELRPAVQSTLLQSLATHLRESTSIAIDHPPRVLAVVGTSPQSPYEHVAESLAEALRAHGSVEIMRFEAFELDGAGDDSTAFEARIDDAERDNDWVIVTASNDEGLARTFALNQSDRCIVVADRAAPPDWLATADRPVDFLFCGRQDDAERWWDAATPASHLYVRFLPSADNLAPLARRLSRKSVGLVLAGGGARGLAHLGVYAELTAAGIPIDRVGGASAGAITGGMIATGFDPDDAIEAARRHMVDARPLTNYTLPAVSLLRGDKLEKIGREFYGNRLIEQLPKEFFAVSSDLISGRQVVHRRGDLWTAIRASIAIPGLMRPVKVGDQLLVDGGLINNLPADVMTEHNEGPVICVDLRRSYRPSSGFGLLPFTPPALIRKFIVGTEEPLPGIQDILMRTVDLAASGVSNSELPGVVSVIMPEVTDIGLLDWGRIDDAVEAGRVAAKIALDEQPDLVP